MEGEISRKISDYIAKEILKQPNRELDPEAPLISTGLIDSFHLVDLALFIEDQFGVKVDDTELNAETFDTINQLIDFLGRK